MKVSVRRTRPGAAAVMIALAVTAFMIVLTVRCAARSAVRRQVTFSAPERVTRTLKLSGRESFLVVLGKFPEAGQARIEAARLVDRGSAGYLRENSGKIEVIGNAYDGREEAERAAVRLRREGIDAQVVTVTVPGEEIGLIATEAQISAFLAARTAVERAMSALSGLSRRLDAGQIDAAAARTQALASAYDLQTETQSFLSAAAGNADEQVTRFCRLIHAQINALSALAAADEGEMYLSSRAKYALIEGILWEWE